MMNKVAPSYYCRCPDCAEGLRMQEENEKIFYRMYKGLEGQSQQLLEFLQEVARHVNDVEYSAKLRVFAKEQLSGTKTRKDSLDLVMNLQSSVRRTIAEHLNEQHLTKTARVGIG